jgi:peptide/nickel transport system permease protein
MPMLVLSIGPLATIARYMRSSMLATLHEDFVRTARAKGVNERIVLYRHVLPNAFNPVLTVIGLLIPPLVGGSVIVEKIFAWPGMGRLAVDAALMRDYPVIMGITVVISVTVAIVNIVTDLLYGVLDPRVRLSPSN